MKLSSGRVLSANRGIIGLAPDENQVYEGYDGVLDADWWSGYGDPPLTLEERRELSEIMVARWKAWAELPPVPPVAP